MQRLWEIKTCIRKFLLYITIKKNLFSSIQEHSEPVLVNSAVPSVQGSMSLTIRERRHKDENYAERVFQHIVKFCKQVRSSFSVE